MPINAPRQPTDPFESQSIGGITGDRFANGFTNGFSGQTAPPTSALGSRQSGVPNYRVATSKRQMVKWFVPERPIVEMYINPQRIVQNYTKEITTTRTKGGYVGQYWGERLTELEISGTTGTSGIEGINVLYDVYRNEQLMFDPYALALANEAERQREEQLSEDLLGVANGSVGAAIGGAIGAVAAEGLGNAVGSAAGSLLSGATGNNPTTTRERPTPASFAFTVEMFWSGEVYRGYFTRFSVTESSENLGMFEYTMGFTVTQKRGFRYNFMPWHRSAVNGPSNSNPDYGTPYSYGGLLGTQGIQRTSNRVDQPNLNRPFVDPGQNGLNSVSGVFNDLADTILDPFDIY